jgi:Flp pilus assembly pilin Flp
MARLLREVLGDRKAQSFLEYSILIAVVAAAFVAMAMYVRQAVQGRIYRLEDSVTAKSNKGSTPWSVPV